MKKYIICFEIFGKKMKTSVLAENKEKAKEVLRSKIIFHKVELTAGVGADLADDMESMWKEMFK